ncbi:MAG TPA: hypothetical protein VFZ89_10205 [Solirubrobacteraceae bacterium]
MLALERGSARRIKVVGLMCAMLAVAYVSVLAIPWARDFFDLAGPELGPAALAAAGSALGICVASVGLRIATARVRSPPHQGTVGSADGVAHTPA